jgi:hypothetical protein
VDGFRDIVAMLLELQMTEADIRTLVGGNAAKLLNLSIA